MEEVKNGGCESICIKNEELPPKDVKYDETCNSSQYNKFFMYEQEKRAIGVSREIPIRRNI